MTAVIWTAPPKTSTGARVRAGIERGRRPTELIGKPEQQTHADVNIGDDAPPASGAQRGRRRRCVA